MGGLTVVQFLLSKNVNKNTVFSLKLAEKIRIYSLRIKNLHSYFKKGANKSLEVLINVVKFVVFLVCLFVSSGIQ